MVAHCLNRCHRPCGPMDKASDYESGDSRFESWQGRRLLPLIISAMTFAFLRQAGARGASVSPYGRYKRGVTAKEVRYDTPTQVSTNS